MKKINIYVLLFCTLFLLSCDDDEQSVDQVLAEVGTGAILRTQSRIGTTFDRNNRDAAFSVMVEEQHDDQGGTITLSSIDLFISFDDNQDDGVNNEVTEQLITTFTEFGQSENGLPTASYETTLGESLNDAGLVDGEFDGGDRFNYRFVANLSDGSSWSSDDVAGTVSGGSFFSSPFLYSVGIVCIPVTPVPGDYQLNLMDSFGDGWDGAFLTVTIDGVSEDFTIDNGSAASFTVTVPDGTTELIFSYTAGNFEGEHTYDIEAPSGLEAASDGPNPAVGEIILNICT